MKVKFLIGALALSGFLLIKPAFAVVEECDQEDCDLPSASASASESQFFLEDANDLPEIDDLAPVATSGQFWPVEGIITGHFGKWRGARHHRGHVHVGVDIAAPFGTTVVAPLDGTVAFVGHKNGYGLTLVIDHGDGVSTLYAHASDILVSEGDVIKKGQAVSKIGVSGHSTGPHLHYEVRMEGKPVNPLAWTEKLQTQRS
jgi:murein DD-endopeptidase MepM/ murein hydrolase activator NlpD